MTARTTRRGLLLSPLLAAGAERASGSSCQTGDPRPVLVLGSSTASGDGASSYERSWAGLLRSAMADAGVRVFNASIPGMGTTASLTRIEREMQTVSPAWVVLATSILNDGLLNSPDIARNRYVTNTRRLADVVRRAGAVPLVQGSYPNDAYGPAHHAVLLSLQEQAERDGWTTWDCLGSTDAGDGRWLPGLSRDGTHPTDTGHALLFDSLPLGLFDATPRFSGPAWSDDVWVLKPNREEHPLRVDPDRPAASWTMAAWWRPGQANEFSQPLLRAADLRLVHRAPAGVLEVLAGDLPVLVTAVPAPGRWTHVCLAWQHASGTVRLFVNGAEYRAPAPPSGPAKSFSLGGPFSGGETAFSQFAVYRSSLGAVDAQPLAEGRITRKSLAAWLPLRETPGGTPLNLAPALATVSAAENCWSKVRADSAAPTLAGGK